MTDDKKPESLAEALVRLDNRAALAAAREYDDITASLRVAVGRIAALEAALRKPPFDPSLADAFERLEEKVDNVQETMDDVMRRSVSSVILKRIAALENRCTARRDMIVGQMRKMGERLDALEDIDKTHRFLFGDPPAPPEAKDEERCVEDVPAEGGFVAPCSMPRDHWRHDKFGGHAFVPRERHDKCRWCDKDERDDHEHGDHVYMPTSLVPREKAKEPIRLCPWRLHTLDAQGECPCSAPPSERHPDDYQSDIEETEHLARFGDRECTCYIENDTAFAQQAESDCPKHGCDGECDPGHCYCNVAPPKPAETREKAKCGHRFTVMSGSPEEAAFKRCYAEVGNKAVADAHPDYCSQCLYSLAADYFYHGIHAFVPREKAKEYLNSGYAAEGDRDGRRNRETGEDAARIWAKGRIAEQGGEQAREAILGLGRDRGGREGRAQDDGGGPAGADAPRRSQPDLAPPKPAETRKARAWEVHDASGKLVIHPDGGICHSSYPAAFTVREQLPGCEPVMINGILMLPLEMK